MHLAKSNDLLNFLGTYNLKDNHKTFTASLPAPEKSECKKMLLRGLIDGDGNVRDGFRLFTASEKLKDSLVTLVKELFNYDLTVSITKTKKNSGFTVSSKVDFWPYLIDIYQGFEEYRIKRKKDIINKKVYDIVQSHKMINYES